MDFIIEMIISKTILVSNFIDSSQKIDGDALMDDCYNLLPKKNYVAYKKHSSFYLQDYAITEAYIIIYSLPSIFH